MGPCFVGSCVPHVVCHVPRLWQAAQDVRGGGVEALTGDLKLIFADPSLPVPDKCEILFIPFRFNVMAAAT